MHSFCYGQFSTKLQYYLIILLHVPNPFANFVPKDMKITKFKILVLIKDKV